MTNVEESDNFGTLASMWKALEAFEAGIWDEIELTIGERRLVVGIGGGATGLPTVLAPTPAASGRPIGNSAPEPTSPTGGSAFSASTPAASGTAPAAEDLAGAVAVPAPSVGIFYAQSEPGAPPFVSVGDKVEVGSTLCIIEVMKLMTHVNATVRGRIVKIMVDNGTQVERDQTLFLIQGEPG